MIASIRFGRHSLFGVMTIACLFLLSSARPAPRNFMEPEIKPYLHPTYEPIIRQINDETEIPLEILSRMIDLESGWDCDMISKPNRNGTRDMGLMQLNSAYLAYFARYNDGQPVDPLDPQQNLKVGMRYLSDLYDRMGSWYNAVAAYNAGPGRVSAGNLPATTKRYLDHVFGGGEDEVAVP